MITIILIIIKKKPKKQKAILAMREQRPDILSHPKQPENQTKNIKQQVVDTEL